MSPEHAETLAHKLLNENFWLPGLEPDKAYTRTHDDHDGTFFPKVSVLIGRDGDAWLSTLSAMPDAMISLRFRTSGGGGSSLRVRNAVLLLAEAIRLDNEERPEPKPDHEQEASSPDHHQPQT